MTIATDDLFPFHLASAGYAHNYIDGLISNTVSSGFDKPRLDFLNPQQRVVCSVRLRKTQVDEFYAFFRAHEYHSFLCDMIITGSALRRHRVSIVPGSVRFAGYVGTRAQYAFDLITAQDGTVPPDPVDPVDGVRDLVTTDGMFHGWSVRRRLNANYTGPIIAVSGVHPSDPIIDIYADDEGLVNVAELIYASSQIVGDLPDYPGLPSWALGLNVLRKVYDQVDDDRIAWAVDLLDSSQLDGRDYTGLSAPRYFVGDEYSGVTDSWHFVGTQIGDDNKDPQFASAICGGRSQTFTDWQSKTSPDDWVGGSFIREGRSLLMDNPNGLSAPGMSNGQSIDTGVVIVTSTSAPSAFDIPIGSARADYQIYNQRPDLTTATWDGEVHCPRFSFADGPELWINQRWNTVPWAKGFDFGEPFPNGYGQPYITVTNNLTREWAPPSSWNNRMHTLWSTENIDNNPIPPEDPAGRLGGPGYKYGDGANSPADSINVGEFYYTIGRYTSNSSTQYFLFNFTEQYITINETGAYSSENAWQSEPTHRVLAYELRHELIERDTQ